MEARRRGGKKSNVRSEIPESLDSAQLHLHCPELVLVSMGTDKETVVAERRKGA
jgi:hypothetical protein